MGTAFLRSQNCVRDRFRPVTLTHPRSSPSTNSNTSSGRYSDPNTTTGRQKRSPAGSRSGGGRWGSKFMVEEYPAKNLVMGQVKILKRGETLCSVLKQGNNPDREVCRPVANCSDDLDLVLGSTNRLGPDPETVPIPGFLGRNKRLL